MHSRKADRAGLRDGIPAARYLEKFESFIQPLWLATMPYTILRYDKAISLAQNLSSLVIFTNSSA